MSIEEFNNRYAKLGKESGFFVQTPQPDRLLYIYGFHVLGVIDVLSTGVYWRRMVDDTFSHIFKEGAGKETTIDEAKAKIQEGWQVQCSGE